MLCVEEESKFSCYFFLYIEAYASFIKHSVI